MENKFTNWTDILINKLAAWWVILIANLPNIVLATIVAAVFIFVARFIRKITARFMPRILGRHSVNTVISNIAYMLVILFGLFVTLNILNLNQAVSSLLAGAGIIGLALGFAFQDLSANFISGIYIAFKRPFEVGQTVETNGYMGNIEDIQLRSTTIRTFQGLHLMIPNKDIFQKPIINYSRSEERRLEFEFSIAPQYDLKKVYELCKKGVDKLDYIVKQKPVEIYFTGFADNVIKVAVWFWIYNHKPPGFMVARHDAIMNIRSILYENGMTLIVTPFPPSGDKQEEGKPVKDKIIDNHQNANA